jgi:hypothetical protein
MGWCGDQRGIGMMGKKQAKMGQKQSKIGDREGKGKGKGTRINLHIPLELAAGGLAQEL